MVNSLVITWHTFIRTTGNKSSCMTLCSEDTLTICRTALVGKFNKGEMEAGQEARLTGLEEDEHGVKIPILRKTEEDSEHLHRRQIGQCNFICKGGIIQVLKSINDFLS